LGSGTVRKFDWRGMLWNLAGAGVLGALAAGFCDMPGVLAALTPRLEPTGSAFFIAAQLRWAAGVAAAFLVLRATGLFKIRTFRKAVALLGRGSTGRWIIAIFLIALVVRLGYVAVAERPAISDEQYYDGLAQALAAGEGYTAGGVPTAYWPVGYPALLAIFYTIFGHYYLPVLLFQSLLGAATAAAVVLLGGEFGSPSAGRAAGLIIALSPNQVAYVARLFPAVASAFALVVIALLVLKTRGLRGAALAGVVTGAAALVAPVMLVAVLAAPVADAFRRVKFSKIVARGAVLAAVAAAVVAPWTYRNWRAFGEFVPISTNGGVNLWIGNNPNATGAYNYPTSRINPLFMTEGELARDRLGREFSCYFMKNNTEQFLLLAIPKFAYTYGADVSAFQYGDIARGVDSVVAATRFPARLAQSYYALLWVGFVLGLVETRRRFFRAGTKTKIPIGALLSWPAALTLVYLVFFGGGRFHFPMVPFMAVAAAFAVAGEQG
jgi:4-amino-4-deoxy-L-arabinose transferase-like glycosyltransferase